MNVAVALIVVTALVLSVAACLTLYRLVRGPSVLDRVVALDVLIAVLVAALGLEAVVARHSVALPILVALSLTGFVGSAAAARFVARRDAEAPPDDEAGPLGRRLRRHQ